MKKLENWPYSSEIPSLKKAIRMERAKAYLFQNPSKEVQNIEILKMQFLNINRQAYRFVDKNILDKNILQAPSAYLYTLLIAKEFQFYLNKCEKNADTTYMKDYIAGLKDYSNYLFENISGWTINAFSFPIRHLGGALHHWEHERYNFDKVSIDYGSFRDIMKISEIMPSKIYDDNDSVCNDINELFYGTYDDFSTISQYVCPIFFKSQKINENFDKISALNKKIEKEKEHDKVLNLLNSSLYGYYLTIQTEKLIEETKKEATPLNIVYSIFVKVKLESLKNSYSNLASKLFHNIMSSVISEQYNDNIHQLNLMPNNNIFS